MYTQNTKFERIYKPIFRIPNVCMLVVTKPKKNINKHTIKIINKGGIKNDS